MARANNAWWVVFAATIGLIVGNGPILQFAYGVFLRPLTEEFRVDRATLSTAILVGFIATGLSTLVVGRLVDRYGIRAVVLPSIVLFALSIAALSLSPASPAFFIALYGVAGVFAGGQTPLPYAKAVAGSFDRRRGLALGIAMTGVGIGTILIPQLAQYLISLLGWRGAYVGLGMAVFLIAFPPVYLFLRDPVAAVQKANGEVAGLTAIQATRTPQFWSLAFIFFALVCVPAGVIAHIVPILTDQGISPQIATSAISAAGVALIVGRLIAGYMLDRIWAPYVTLFFIFIPMMGLGLLFLPITPTVAVAATICVGLGLGAEVDLIAFMIARYFGFRSFGEIYGYLFAVFTFGSGLGPFLMGLSFSKTGAYSTAIVVMTVGLMIAACLVLLLGPYRYANLLKHEIETEA
ncbi:MFS transporter [Agrobacterium tumefaciens]|uniref:MFS transporter n=1 Tax=Agrobacterium tumefaciens TaxID=358 RepID=A0AA44F669_AGRTU|nr:MFS transporter [Agrobacterium tumefaciens]NSL21303.1 MFS transporter [Agrobacterium tumefaciens]NTB83875.1 MFS transporter [Agrobacterium tumefaciens]NTC20656.1 MFS transporter [Agrobacterium tumefaciens]NTC29346.1 MFS transporter [Agrobacterium tumefaciens]NTC57842.1 MFS transporter [Agrobacterium tumefaciens]